MLDPSRNPTLGSTCPAWTRENPLRIHIVGMSGAGKTTLAHDLQHVLGAPHVELDQLFWDTATPEWNEVNPKTFMRRVRKVVAGDAWILDGSVMKVIRAHQVIWRRARALIWLDYELSLTLANLERRTAENIRMKKRLHGGYDTWERFREHCKESRPKHQALRNYFGQVFAGQKYPRLDCIRLSSPEEAKLWLASVEREARRRPALLRPLPVPGRVSAMVHGRMKRPGPSGS